MSYAMRKSKEVVVNWTVSQLEINKDGGARDKFLTSVSLDLSDIASGLHMDLIKSEQLYNETVINYFNNESVMELVIDPEPDNTETDTVTTTPVNTGTPVDTVGEGVGKVNSENEINIKPSYVDPITSLLMFEPVMLFQAETITPSEIS